jgi:DNA-binding transcriptional LysR family regulator
MGSAEPHYPAERLLLAEDGYLFVAKAKSEETARRFATKGLVTRHPSLVTQKYLKSGELIAPFQDRVAVTRKYFVIVAPAAGGQRRVKQFVDWLFAEAKTA